MKFSVKLHNQKIVISKAGESECRYGLYDFEYEHQCQGTTEVSKKQKLFLMSWCPDTARIKKKMLYSSSFDALKKALVGVHKYIQVSILITQSRTSPHHAKTDLNKRSGAIHQTLYPSILMPNGSGKQKMKILQHR